MHADICGCDWGVYARNDGVWNDAVGEEDALGNGGCGAEFGVDGGAVGMVYRRYGLEGKDGASFMLISLPTVDCELREESREESSGVVFIARYIIT